MTDLTGSTPAAAPEAAAPVTPDTSAPEAAKPEAAPVEPPKETASALLAKLARQKKEKLMASKKLSESDAEKAQLKARLAELEQKVSKKPGSPLEALQAAGYSYKDATDFILNNSEMTPEQQIKAVKEEIEALRKSRDDEKKEAEAEQKRRAQADYNAAITNFKSEIQAFVESNQEKLELTHRYGGQDLIFELIAQHAEASFKEWREQGGQGNAPRIMSIEEAANLVEKDYEEKWEQGLQTKKFSARYAPTQAQGGGEKSTGTTAKTLANTVTSSSAPAGGGRVNDPVARALAALDKLSR